MGGMKANESCRCYLTRRDGTEWIVTELHLGEGGPFVTARRAHDGAENGARTNGGAGSGHPSNGAGSIGGAVNGHPSNGAGGIGGAANGHPSNGGAGKEGVRNGSLREEPLTAGDRLEWVSDDGTVRWAMRIPVGLGNEEELRRTA